MFVLVIVTAVAGGSAVAMQEFGTKNACESAVETIKLETKTKPSFQYLWCFPKN
jgi:hypothetical protein